MNSGQIGVVALAAAVLGGATAWAVTSASDGGRDYVDGVVTLNQARAEDVDATIPAVEIDVDNTKDDDGTEGGNNGGPNSKDNDSTPGNDGTRGGDNTAAAARPAPAPAPAPAAPARAGGGDSWSGGESWSGGGDT